MGCLSILGTEQVGYGFDLLPQSLTEWAERSVSVLPPAAYRSGPFVNYPEFFLAWQRVHWVEAVQLLMLSMLSAEHAMRLHLFPVTCVAETNKKLTPLSGLCILSLSLSRLLYGTLRTPMSIQLSESCSRWLSPYYSRSLLFVKTPCRYRQRFSTLRRYQQQQTRAWATASCLRTNSSSSNSLYNEFCATLQQGNKAAGQLWNTYSRLLEDHQQEEPSSLLTVGQYEEFMNILYARALSTRRSINWQRLTQVYRDSPGRTRSMVLMAITAFGRTGQLDAAQAAFDDLLRQGFMDAEAYQRMIEAALDCENRLQMAYQLIQDARAAGVWNNKKNDELCCLKRYVSVCLIKGNLRRAVGAVLDDECTDQDIRQALSVDLWKGYMEYMRRHGVLSTTTTTMEVETFVEAFALRLSSVSTGKIKLPASERGLFTAERLATLFRLWTTSQPEYVPTVKTCDVLLRVFAEQGQHHFVRDILDLMKRHDLQPTSVVFSQLAGTVLSAPDAFALFQRLSRKKQMMEKTDYEAFIATFLGKGAIDEAIRVVKKMRKQRFEPSVATVSAITQTLAENGEFQKALDWLRQSEYPDRVIARYRANDSDQTTVANMLDPYAIIMEAMVQRGEWSQCIGQLKSMKAGVLQPIVEKNRRIVKATIAARFALGDFLGCKTMLARRQIEFTPTTVFRITQSLLDIRNGGQYRVPGHLAVRGLELLQRELDIQVSGKAIGQIIRKLGQRGDIHDAYQLYRWTRGKSKTGSDNDEDDCYAKKRRRQSLSYVFLAMMEVAITNNDIRKVESVWFDMNHHHCITMPSEQKNKNATWRPSLSLYNVLLNSYATRQPRPHLTRLTRTFERMIQEGYEPDTVTYNTLIKAFVNLGNLDAAFRIYRKMWQSGHQQQQPDNWTVNTMIRGIVEEKEWERLEQFLKELCRHHYHQIRLDNVTFNLIIQGLLHLDKRHLAHVRMLKLQNNWSAAKKLRDERPYSLSSETIWEIFECGLGKTREDLLLLLKRRQQFLKENEASRIADLVDRGIYGEAAQVMADLATVIVENKKKQDGGEEGQQQSRGGLLALFQSSSSPPEPDEVTYKLFIKAFLNAGDTHSASLVYQYWMDMYKHS